MPFSYPFTPFTPIHTNGGESASWTTCESRNLQTTSKGFICAARRGIGFLSFISLAGGNIKGIQVTLTQFNPVERFSDSEVALFVLKIDRTVNPLEHQFSSKSEL